MADVGRKKAATPPTPSVASADRASEDEASRHHKLLLKVDKQ